MTESYQNPERRFEIPEDFPSNMYILPGTTEEDFAFFYSKYRNSEKRLFAKLNSEETLRQALRDDDYDVVMRVIELVVQGGFESLLSDTKETLKKALRDERWFIRLRAVELVVQGGFEEEFKKDTLMTSFRGLRP